MRKIEKQWAERFWSYIDKSAGPEACWPFTLKARDRKGYGIYSVREVGGTKLTSWRTHRLAWILTHDDPGELHVLHRCDNPICCNPAHLFLGTNADNVADMLSKGRTRKGSAHKASKLTEEQVAQARTDYIAGSASAEDLCARYGVTDGVMRAALRGAGWKHVEMPEGYAEAAKRARPRGERNGSAKLTQAQVDEIRAVYAKGGTRQGDLAERYGVSQSLISVVVRGEVWASPSVPKAVPGHHAYPRS